MAAPGQFHWNELLTGDPAAAARFFEQLLGWATSEMPMPQGTYRVMMQGDQPVAGIMAFPPDMPAGMPPFWEAYVAVADVDAAVRRTRELGGTVAREPWDIPGVGRIAFITDPQGALLGLITPANG